VSFDSIMFSRQDCFIYQAITLPQRSCVNSTTFIIAQRLGLKCLISCVDPNFRDRANYSILDADMPCLQPHHPTLPSRNNLDRGSARHHTQIQQGATAQFHHPPVTKRMTLRQP